MLFVSYSRANRTGLEELLPRLRGANTEVWVDQEQIPVGEAFVEHIWTGLTSCRFYLLLDTPAAQRSYWVRKEIEAAAALRRSGHFELLARLSAPGTPNYFDCDFDLELVDSEDCPGRLRDALSTFPQSQGRTMTAPRRTPLLGRPDLGQPKYWTGRQHELGRLDDWWVGQSRGLWIHGVGGIGKTGLLQTWITVVRTLGAHKNMCDGVHYLPGREITSTSELKDFTNSGDPSRKLLAVDGLDESRDAARGELLLRQFVQYGGRAVTVSRALPDHPDLRSFARIELAPFDSASASALLEGLRLSPEETREILQMTGGHPVALTQLRALLQSDSLNGAELIRRLRESAGDA